MASGRENQADDRSLQLLAQVQAGDEQAAGELFDRYVNRLVRLEQSRLSKKLGRKVDPEDIVHSAYRSFFIAARDGRFSLEQSGDLWRLLAAITVRKIHGQAKYHGAQKRGLNAEQSICGIGSDSFVAPEAVARDPSPDEAVAVVEEVEQLIKDLDPLQQQMVELRLQGHTLHEIADKVQRSQRTVRRLMEKVKANLEQRVHNSDANE